MYRSLKEFSVDRRIIGLGSLGATAVLTFLLALRISEATSGKVPNHVIQSPLDHVESHLSKAQQAKLPYPPDDPLPGARDVRTPYGRIRVYEWGLENGRKVLLVHGISTPCVALEGLAEALVRRGCRVMLFDLFGRGYSDTPDPNLFPQDIKLFTTQILLVLASSPLSWTSASDGFALVGYSLGGGIAATFTSYFPKLVNSLILIAPGGLMRSSHIHWTSKLMYSSLLPSSLASWFVWRRLGGHKALKKPQHQGDVVPTDAIAAEVVDEAETPSHPALARDSTALASRRRPASIAEIVDWQLHAHKGFLPAFISSIKHAPITGQHDRWKMIAVRLAIQRASPQDAEVQKQGLREGKVLLILGAADDVVVADEVSQDAKEVMGGDSVDVRVLDGGHDVPFTAPETVAETMAEFWSRPLHLAA